MLKSAQASRLPHGMSRQQSVCKTWQAYLSRLHGKPGHALLGVLQGCQALLRRVLADCHLHATMQKPLQQWQQGEKSYLLGGDDVSEDGEVEAEMLGGR